MPLACECCSSAVRKWIAVVAAQGRVNLDCWTRVTELYEVTVSKGMTLSPGLHYNMMRTAILMANAGHLDALHFAKQCLDDMHHLGACHSCLFRSRPFAEILRTQENISVKVQACFSTHRAGVFFWQRAAAGSWRPAFPSRTDFGMSCSLLV